MSSNGDSDSEELHSGSWSRLPDSDGRRILVFDSPGSRWLIWERPNIGRGGIFAFELKTFELASRIVDRWGMPPDEVQSDWRRQFAKLMAQPATEEDASRCWSSLVVSERGELRSLFDLESELMREPEADLAVSHPASATFEEGLCLASEASQPRVPSWLWANRQITSASNALKPPSSSITESLLSEETKKQRVLGTSAVKLGTERHDGTAKSARFAFDKRIVAAAGGGILGIIACGAWFAFSGGEPEQVALQTNPQSAGVEKAPVVSADSDHQTNIESSKAPEESADNQPTLTLASSDPDDDSLASRAAASMSSLLTGFGSASTSEDLNAAAFDSVKKLLASNDEKSVIEESLGKKSDTSNPSGTASEQTSSSPFADLPDDDSAMAAENAVENSEATSDSIVANSTVDPKSVAFKSEKFIATKTLAKTMFKLPFRVYEKQAVCRAELKLPEGMLYRPEGSMLIAGKQDVSWLIALKDESASLTLYMRSKPGRNWSIATSVRAKFEGNEYSIGPGDAKAIVQRLQLRFKWLADQKQLVETAKANAKVKSDLIEALREIDKESTRTEKSLAAWQEIAVLSDRFYKGHEIRLIFAAANDQLPTEVQN